MRVSKKFKPKSRSSTGDQVWPLSVVGGLFWFFIVCVSVRWHVSSVEFVDASFATCYLIHGTSEHGRRWAFVTPYKKFRGNVFWLREDREQTQSIGKGRAQSTERQIKQCTQNIRKYEIQHLCPKNKQKCIRNRRD